MESRPAPPPLVALRDAEFECKEEKYALEQWLISLAPNHIYEKLGLGADFFDSERWFLHGIERSSTTRAFTDQYGAVRSIDTFMLNVQFRHVENKSQLSMCRYDDRANSQDGDDEFTFSGDFSPVKRDGGAFTGNGLVMTEAHVKEAAREYSIYGALTGEQFFPAAARTPEWGEW